jgi:integrase
MRGSGAQLWQRRLIPVLIALGLRPEDICAMRHFWWRTDRGPKEKIWVEEAVKNIAGHLFTGEPKTGTRELHLFEFVASLLERLYQAQGEPGLAALVFPGLHGGLLQWGNWVHNIWYPALYRSGVAHTLDGDERRYPTDGIDAFDPYLLRHVGVTTMLHALVLDQDGRPARYSEREVARQFGHTTATLSRVYGGIPQDMHRVRGKFMSEIFDQAWHEIWGPMPGEKDYEQVLLTTPQAFALIAAHAENDHRFKPVSVKSLGGRIARGSLPALQRGNRYLLSDWDLAWHGLIPPAGQRNLQ